MFRSAAVALLLATPVFAGEPFIGDEQLFHPDGRPSGLVLAASPQATLLAWNEGDRVKARSRGVTLDLGSGSDVAVATDGSDFLIAWQEPTRIAGVRWSNPAATLELVRFLSGTPVTNLAPRVVWDGTRFIVFAASEPAAAAAAANGVAIATTVTSTGAYYACIPSGLSHYCRTFPAYYQLDWSVRGSASPLQKYSLQQTGYSSPYLPGMAAGRDDFLIAWKSVASIDGVRLNRDGSRAGYFGIPIAHPLTGQRGPQIAFDGTRYLVVFDTVDASGDIWGAIVEPGGTYIASPFVIAGSGAQELGPSVAALGPDRFVVSYVKDAVTIAMRTISFSEPARRRAVR
jgi:hypothetical protein